jgi:L-fuconate dehydratase
MIRSINNEDRRFPLSGGAGSDAIHRDPVYSYAVTNLVDDSGLTGTGFAFTLGEGNQLVCSAANYYANKLVGKDIEEVMSRFGSFFNQLSNEQQFRWLGPHKGVVHLALASVTNACFDLWAKKRGVPLWELLIDLSAEEIVNTLDLSYLEDELTREQALDILNRNKATQEDRFSIIEKGDDIKIMLDANQQWTLPQALDICKKLQAMQPYWIEEPTHPDDVLAHKTLADAIAPIKLALGEHVPNRVIFKNYLQTKCAGFIQVDAVRVGGVSEFITVSLLCRKFNIPVVPHVGDMGQLHQHLVLFNHIAMGHEALFLEYIPHLRDQFLFPARVEGGVYKTPQHPGSSCDLK